MTTSSKHSSAPRTAIRRRAATAAFAVTAGLSIAACSDSAPTGTETSGTSSASPSTGAAALATAEIKKADGTAAGEVTFSQEGDAMAVSVTVDGMDPGFYGFHIHQTGTCEPDSAAPDDPAKTGDFLSAGGHLAGMEGAKHPDHAGDLPPLLVGEDGTATMSVTTDRLDESMLFDDDGSAVMIHSGPDNFANIPERYAPDGPDEETLKAGDSGDRLACGVLEK